MWKNGPAKNKNPATQNKKPRKIFQNFAFRKFRKICGYPAEPQRKIQKIEMRKIKNGRPKIKKWAAKNKKAADQNPKTPAPNLKRAGPKSLPGCSPCPLGAPGMFPYGEVSVKWLKPKCEISKNNLMPPQNFRGLGLNMSPHYPYVSYLKRENQTPKGSAYV